MSDKFHSEIADTKQRVLAMGHLATGMLQEAMEALATNDTERAARVKESKRKISDETNALEEEMYRLIAL